MANINDIATTTNYNGIPLLDGTWFRRANTELVAKLSQKEPTPIQEIDSVTQNNLIEADGVYIIPKGYSGTVKITEDAKNVEIR